MRIHSLTTRFVLTLLLSTAVPFLVFGWFVRNRVQERLERDQVTVMLLGHAGLVAERLDGLRQEYYRECETMVDYYAKDALAPSADPAVRAMRIGRFKEQVDFRDRFHDKFQAVLLADATGKVVASVYSSYLDSQTADARRVLEPESVREQDWFQRTVVDGQGFHRVDRHLSPFLHRNTQALRLDPAYFSLGFAFLVLGDDGPLGVMFALVNWQSFQEVVDRAADSLAEPLGFTEAQSFLCDDRGVILAHHDRNLYNRTLPPNLLESVLSGPERTVAPFVDVREDGRDERPSLAGLARVADFDWFCGVTAPNDQLFATSREFGRQILLGSALVAVMLVVWSLFASRRILRPVRGLVEATERVAKGDLTARVPIRGRDELADLGRAFNHMAEDVSESREQLRAAERQAAWAEMARQVAHEIKNPLTPMRMAAQLLLKAQRDGDPRLAELIERLGRTVIEQTEALARIASDFRTFAGRPRYELEVVEADDLLEDIQREFAAVIETGSSTVRSVRGAPGVRVRVDRQEIRRVFINLVQNALAACGDGGTVEVASRVDDGRVVFSVRDDGPGIPPEVTDKLFEPYFTTRSSGTGLGLAISKRLVEAQGGTIALTGSVPGATEFRVDLAVWTGEAAAVPVVSAEPSELPEPVEPVEPVEPADARHDPAG